MPFFVLVLLRPLLLGAALIGLTLVLAPGAKPQNLAVAVAPAVAKPAAPAQISRADVGLLVGLVLGRAKPVKPVSFHARHPAERDGQGDLVVTTPDGTRYAIDLYVECMDIRVHQSPPSAKTTRHFGVCLDGTVDTGDPVEAVAVVKIILELYRK